MENQELLIYIIPPLIVVIIIKGILIYKRLKSDKNFIYFTFILLIGNTLLVLPQKNIYFNFIKSSWNWEGKFLMLFFSIICLILFKKNLNRDKVGLTFRQKNKSIKPALMFTLIYLSIITIGAIATKSLPNSISSEEILWNTSILPDFTEELFERGILLVLLNNIFGKKWTFFGAKIGIGFFLICLLFALEHSFSVNNLSQLFFKPLNFTRTLFMSGMAFTWLKERTESLVFPTILHFGSEMILTIVILFS